MYRSHQSKSRYVQQLADSHFNLIKVSLTVHHHDDALIPSSQ